LGLRSDKGAAAGSERQSKAPPGDRYDAEIQNLAIQPKKAPAGVCRARRGPAKKQSGELASREGATDSEAMNKGSLICRGVRPEKSVPPLKLDCAGHFRAAAGEEKMTGRYVGGDPLER
jgi:hypothetical protein